MSIAQINMEREERRKQGEIRKEDKTEREEEGERENITPSL